MTLLWWVLILSNRASRKAVVVTLLIMVSGGLLVIGTVLADQNKLPDTTPMSRMCAEYQIPQNEC